MMLSKQHLVHLAVIATVFIGQADHRVTLTGCYLESMELDPDGPAAEAYRHIQELLDFYNKDYYNP